MNDAKINNQTPAEQALENRQRLDAALEAQARFNVISELCRHHLGGTIITEKTDKGFEHTWRPTGESPK